MFSVFCASHSRLHWPVALRCRANLSSSICSRSFFQRRYSALSRPVIDIVMSTEPPFGPGRRLWTDQQHWSFMIYNMLIVWSHILIKKNSQSTLSPVQILFSRFQSPALPSSVRVSCCLLSGPYLEWDQNAWGRPKSYGLVYLHPAEETNYKPNTENCDTVNTV